MHIQAMPNTSTANTYTNAGSQSNRHHLDLPSSRQAPSLPTPQAQTQRPNRRPVAPQAVVIRTGRPRAVNPENQGQPTSGASSPRAGLTFDHPRRRHDRTANLRFMSDLLGLNGLA